jgi:Fanconi anemia group M protein
MKNSIKIIVDNRERNTAINEYLSSRAVVEFRTLNVGDYIVSDRIAVERKTVGDFQSSILNGRIFDQVQRLAEHYPRPIIIMEGDQKDFMLGRKVFVGAIVALYVDYNVSVIFSKGPTETAELIVSIAEHEQDDEKREPSIKGGARAYTTSDFQRFMIGNMPGVGPKLAKSLLGHFGNVRNIANASEEELMKVEKIGAKKAKGIRRVMDEKFDQGHT